MRTLKDIHHNDENAELELLSLTLRLCNNKPTINISAEDEYAFRYACRNGYLNVAQWLLQIKPTINISAKNDYAFKWSCSFGHLNIVQWLLQMKPTINISASEEYAFREACSNGHLNVAQWLLQIKPTIDISAKNEEAFIRSCINWHLNVAQWLVSLRPDKYKIMLNGYGDIDYEITKQLNIIGTKEVSETETCPICYLTVCDVITECNHSYCNPCISSWLHANHTSCPTCRKNIENTEFKKLVPLS